MARHPHRTRRKPRFSRRTKPGAMPGTIAAPPDALAPVIRSMAFGPDTVEEAEVREPEKLTEALKRNPVTWVHVDGLGSPTLIQILGQIFSLHMLALEDVVNVHQRAKVDPYDAHLFVVARIVKSFDPVDTEQISMFVGKNYVLTFQERPGAWLDPVRDRLRRLSGRIHKCGTDYLTYTILDAIIDSYFPAIESLADRLDELEIRVLNRREKDAFLGLHEIRNDLLILRRAIRPHRDAINELIRDDSPFIDDETRVYLRDCYDHVVQLIELLEVYREMCGDLRDYYLSAVSNRLNEVMKLLTIISTVFMPLSFIAGVYGMNFDRSRPWNMPELGWSLGYLLCLALMGAVAIGLMSYFYRKGWLSDGDPPKSN